MTHVMENKIKHFLSDKEKEKLKNKKTKDWIFHSFIKRSYQVSKEHKTHDRLDKHKRPDELRRKIAVHGNFDNKTTKWLATNPRYVLRIMKKQVAYLHRSCSRMHVRRF